MLIQKGPLMRMLKPKRNSKNKKLSKLIDMLPNINYPRTQIKNKDK